MRLDDLVRTVKADSRSGDPAHHVPCAEKLLEDMWQVAGWYADTMIGHTKAGLGPARGVFHIH